MEAGLVYMESTDCREAGPCRSLAVERNASMTFSSSPDMSTRAARETEWHSIPLGDASRAEVVYSFQSEEKQSSQQPRKLELSMCGLSNLIGGEGNDDTESVAAYVTGSKKDGAYVSVESSDALSGEKEVRLTFHGVEDSNNGPENAVYMKGNKVVNDSVAGLGYGDEGCLPLLHQVRAFIKGAKLSCSGLLPGDNRAFLFDGWGSLLQRSFSFKSSETSSSEGESLCRKGNSSGLARTVSTPMPMTCPILSTEAPDMLKAGPLHAKDPQSRAEALPLAHYRPTDGVIWKEGEAKTGQSTPSDAACKSSVNINCKKPPKPPRHPGRSASLDSASLAALRSAKKSRDRSSARRKSRAASTAASTGVTPLVALVLTMGFAILMVFQGVFVQTNVSYGKDTDRAFADSSSKLRSSISTQGAASFGLPYRISPLLPASSNVDVSKSEAVVSDAFHKSMSDLPWSRSSLSSQMKSVSG